MSRCAKSSTLELPGAVTSACNGITPVSRPRASTKKRLLTVSACSAAWRRKESACCAVQPSLRAMNSGVIMPPASSSLYCSNSKALAANVFGKALSRYSRVSGSPISCSKSAISSGPMYAPITRMRSGAKALITATCSGIGKSVKPFAARSTGINRRNSSRSSKLASSNAASTTVSGWVRSSALKSKRCPARSTASSSFGSRVKSVWIIFHLWTCAQTGASVCVSALEVGVQIAPGAA